MKIICTKLIANTLSMLLEIRAMQWRMAYDPWPQYLHPTPCNTRKANLHAAVKQKDHHTYICTQPNKYSSTTNTDNKVPRVTAHQYDGGLMFFWKNAPRIFRSYFGFVPYKSVIILRTNNSDNLYFLKTFPPIDSIVYQTLRHPSVSAKLPRRSEWWRNFTKCLFTTLKVNTRKFAQNTQNDVIFTKTCKEIRTNPYSSGVWCRYVSWRTGERWQRHLCRVQPRLGFFWMYIFEFKL